MKIKVISLWQPWAQLVVLGLKTKETRSWYTGHRAILGIHATAAMNDFCRSMYNSDPFYKVLNKAGYGQESLLPKGAIIGLVTLDAVKQIVAPETIDFNPKIYCRAPQSPELEFGDYRPGRYAWDLKEHYQLIEPIPVSGRQLLWDYDLPEEIYDEYMHS